MARAMLPPYWAVKAPSVSDRLGGEHISAISSCFTVASPNLENNSTLHHQKTLTLSTDRQGLYEITRQVADFVSSSGVTVGLCTLFVRHTSASLVIQENADPSVQRDLQQFFARLVPEGDRLYTHTDEGDDDMPAHVKTAMTSTSLGIPIGEGRLALGTWQGIFLWEHRSAPHRRKIVVHISE